MKEKREKKNINKNTLWRKTGSWPSVAGVYNCRIEGKTDWFLQIILILVMILVNLKTTKKKHKKEKQLV